MKYCLLLLALCLPQALRAQVLQAQDNASEQDSSFAQRRLRVSAGLGTQRALHAGLEWHIPLSMNGRHIFAPNVTLGIRLFEPVFVGSGGMQWLMIGRGESRGGMIGISATIENAGRERDVQSRRIITLHPGVILRAGQSLLTLTAGAGPSFTHRERGEGARLTVTDETDIFYNVSVSLTYDLVDLFD